MARMWNTWKTMALDFGRPAGPRRGQNCRRGLRLVVPDAGPALRGPDKYQVLEMRRRRAQIRARRVLQLVNS
jgi:hypothetical protein